MDKKSKPSTGEKVLLGSGLSVGAAGATTALAGETIAWSIFSAGPGAALTGICETNAFLAWLGGGSLAAGGSGMAGGAAVLAAMGPVGWVAAGVGASAVAVSIIRMRKRCKNRKGGVNKSNQ